MKNIINLKPVKSAIPVGAGYVGARFVSNALANQNPLVRIGAQVVAGGFVYKMGGKSGKEAAVGFGLSALFDGIRQYSPGMAQTIGIAGYLPGPGFAPRNHAVAGPILNGTGAQTIVTD